MQRPSFSDLTPEQQRRFGNGVGPYWLSAGVRQAITGTASWFFRSACWRHHDFGYCVGGDRWDRARCDWKFLQAMLWDAVRMRGWAWPLAMPVALLLSLIFYVAVRLGGQCGSFKYRDRYATLEEVIADCR